MTVLEILASLPDVASLKKADTIIRELAARGITLVSTRPLTPVSGVPGALTPGVHWRTIERPAELNVPPIRPLPEPCERGGACETTSGFFRVKGDFMPDPDYFYYGSK
jgi:hypothetical protein